MKHLFLITLFITCQSNVIFAQGFYERHPEIYTFVKDTNSKLTSFEQVILSNEELTEQQMDGGAKLTGYFNNGTIQKIILWVGTSYGNEQIEFYYKDSELYFVNETFNQFKYLEEKGSFDYSKTEQTFHGQYLFEQPFDYETLGHNRFENDELDPEIILRKEAQKYFTLLAKKCAR